MSIFFDVISASTDMTPGIARIAPSTAPIHPPQNISGARIVKRDRSALRDIVFSDREDIDPHADKNVAAKEMTRNKGIALGMFMQAEVPQLPELIELPHARLHHHGE
jgi:hypothetical protein